MPCYLAAPLKPVWREVQSGFPITLPLVGGKRLFHQPDEHDIIATSELGDATFWRSPGYPSVVVGDTILSWGDGVHAISCETGKVAWSTEQIRPAMDATAVGGWIVGVGFDGVDILHGSRLSERRTIWEFRQEHPQNRIELGFCADERGVYFGLGDGTVLGVSLEEGRELWRQKEAGFRGVIDENPMAGFAIVYRDVVIFRFATNVAGVSAVNGKVLWQAEIAATTDGYLYDGRYFATTMEGGYFILDPLTGRTLFKTDLVATLPRKVCKDKEAWRVETFAPMLVSETHVFVGTRSGWLLAFERETGRYAWSFRPQKAGKIQKTGHFVSANGRLYYADLSPSLYCLEEQTPTDPALMEARGAPRVPAARPSRARRAPP